MKDTVNVLSLDGGGVRGILQLEVLERITKEFSQRKFDLIVGTSIGGISAIALNFFTAQEINFLIQSNAEKIFKTTTKENIISGNGWLKSKNNSNNFKEVLKDIFQNRSFQECNKRTIAVSWDIQNEKPKLFKSYQDDMSCIDVAYSTAAAPTYFMPNKYFEHKFVDGGVFFNNPAIIAAQEAELIYPDKKINLLSIGTGKSNKKINIKNCGKLEWSKYIIDLMMSANTEGVDYIVKNTYKNINYLRLQINLTENIELDDYTKIEKLKELGKNMYFQNIEKIITWKQQGGLI